MTDTIPAETNRNWEPFDTITDPNDYPKKAILVNLSSFKERARTELEELSSLCYATGIEHVVACFHFPARKSIPATVLGDYQVEKIRSCIAQYEADVLIFDHGLGARQISHLARLCGSRVSDRTRLIIDLFSKNATTYEGKLQVRLARLNHELSLLVGRWSHLERQRGGIGLRSGSGEKQIEADRQALQRQCKKLKERIESLRRQRGQRRKLRIKNRHAMVCIVGYTNAGKSTLFNQLTGASVAAKDQLFMTLDPTVRSMKLKGIREVLLTDTIGFVDRLPHSLITAFHATLEEVSAADLLLVVCDVTRAQRQLKVIYKALAEIGADHVPAIEIINKIDLVEDPCNLNSDLGDKICISAYNHDHIERLKAMIHRLLRGRTQTYTLVLKDASIRALLYRKDMILKESYDARAHAFRLEVALSFEDRSMLEARYALEFEDAKAHLSESSLDSETRHVV